MGNPESRIQNPESTGRKPAKTFEDLVVWQKSHALVLEVYRLSETFPRKETYGLSSQIRRAAISIPSNIAEGFKKRGRIDKARFFNIAQGSLEEVRYLLRLAQDLHYLDSSYSCWPLLEETSRILESYRSSILDSGS